MRLSDKGRLRAAVRMAFLAGLGASASGVWAQQADQAPAGATPVQALTGVQVTGSRIKQANLTVNSPVTTVNSIEITYQGAQRAEDLLNNLPQVFADQGGNLANGATGTATVNLRNLGANRTLVLIDGRRLVPGDPSAPDPDLNFIPAGLIDHVDVLTGGASAVYGADAVAGVVNFVMKKDFEGVSIDYQKSGYWHNNHETAIQQAINSKGNPAQFSNPPASNWDGFGDNVTLLMGVNSGDGKGNITAYATYLHLNPVFQSNRDFSACTLAEKYPSGFTCSGSSTSAVGRIISFAPDSNPGDYNVGPNNTLVPFSSANNFNFGALNVYQRPDDRYTLGAFGHYDFNKYVQAYTELMFMDDRTNGIIAPSGEFGNALINIPCDGSNPLLSNQQLMALCGSNPGDTGPGAPPAPVAILRRDVEGGNRQADLRHTDYRIVLGVKGAIAGDWTYDAYAQQGTTIFGLHYLNEFSQRKFQNAVNVVKDPNTGQPVCSSVLDGSDPLCVPYNLWKLGGVTPQALAYVLADGLQLGQTREQVVDYSATGSIPVVKSPFADHALAAAVGVEYRRESLEFHPDQEFQAGDLTGQGGAIKPVQGSFDVREAFGELRMPFATNQFLAKDLSAEAGYRYSYYSEGFRTNTYKFGLDWQPIEDVKFRASYNRAVRAPNVVELFQPQSVLLDGSTDPCAGATPTATAAQCAHDPYFAANPGQYGHVASNPANQYNGLLGGNPALQPETANSFTYGIVFTPTAVKDLDFSVDYYRIKVKNLIGVVGADNILNDCYTNNVGCNLIHRDPLTGSLWIGTNGFVIDTNLNTGFERVSGVDVSGNYRLRLSALGLDPKAGTVIVNFVGTRDLTEVHLPDPANPASQYSCEGAYGLQCGTPVPTWRHKLRISYTNTWRAGWISRPTASVAWRYISSVRADQLSAPNADDQKLPSENYIDVFGSIHVHDNYTVRLGINNVFDRDPPIIGSNSLPPVFGSGNTFPQVYDTLGRYVFLGVTAEF